MSDYLKIKALRIPRDKLDLEHIYARLRQEDEDYECDLNEYLENLFPELFNYRKIGKFCSAPTEGDFIDYVLDYEYGANGEYGKTRALYDTEKAKYLPVFQKLDPNVNMDFVRLIEFCWYNSSDAPDYYDDVNDPFYDEV